MTHHSHSDRRLPNRFHGDDGAVLLEAALILPFLVTMVLGITEIGFLWQQQNGLKSTVRAGARQVTNLGNDRTADFYGLQSLKSGFAGLDRVSVVWVSIYKTTSSDGSPVNGACIPANTPPGHTGVAGACNIYVNNDLATLPSSPAAAAGFNSDCKGDNGTSWDHFWCPTDRKAKQGDPPDYVGVQARVRYTTLSKAFGSAITITDRYVMRIEPRIT